MKIAISCESTVDLPSELLEKYDIHIVPFSVLLGDDLSFDGVVTPEAIFKYVEETKKLPQTSAVNSFQYNEHFTKLLKTYDAIIHFSLSSEISSAYQNALNVAKEMENVYVVDSRTLSTGIALLAIYARELAESGNNPQIILEKVRYRIPYVQASFVINTLDYLHKGGRCSGAQRFGALILRIKPQILLVDGKMTPGDTFRGKNSEVIKQYCEATLNKFNQPDKKIVFITHTHASPDMIAEAKKVLEEHGFNLIYETTAGSTITSHCGPKTLGILYFNDAKLMNSQ